MRPSRVRGAVTARMWRCRSSRQATRRSHQPCVRLFGIKASSVRMFSHRRCGGESRRFRLGGCGGESRRLQGCAPPQRRGSERQGSALRNRACEQEAGDRRDSNPVCGAGNAVCFRPDTTVASSAPSGARTRVTGVRDRHPGRLDDRGVKHGRKESNPLRRCWKPHGRHVLVRMTSSSGGIRTTHPSVQSRRSCR